MLDERTAVIQQSESLNFSVAQEKVSAYGICFRNTYPDCSLNGLKKKLLTIANHV